MIAIVFKYGSANLIILVYCTYSRLLNTIGVVTQNSMRLMRMQSLVLGLMDDWNRVQSVLEEGGKCMNVGWYVISPYLLAYSVRATGQKDKAL